MDEIDHNPLNRQKEIEELIIRNDKKILSIIFLFHSQSFNKNHDFSYTSLPDV